MITAHRKFQIAKQITQNIKIISQFNEFYLIKDFYSDNILKETTDGFKYITF